MTKQRLLRPALGLCLAGLLTLGGCAAAAIGVAGGILLNQEVLQNDTVHVRIQKHAEPIWLAAKSYLSEKSPNLIEVDEEHRSARGKIYASKVTIQVAAFDGESTDLYVYAKRNAFNDRQAAEYVMEQLGERMGFQYTQPVRPSERVDPTTGPTDAAATR